MSDRAMHDAVELLEAGDAEAAWLAALRLLQDSPGWWEVHALIATTALETRRPLDIAERAARNAVRLAPDVPEAHAILGDVLLRRGRDEEARRSFLAALAIDPTSTSLRNALGRLDLVTGRPDQAVRRFVDLLAADPTSVRERRNLLLALHETTSRMSVPVVLGTVASALAPMLRRRLGLPQELADLAGAGSAAVDVAVVVVLNIRFIRSAGHKFGRIVRAARYHGIHIVNRWEAIALATVFLAVSVVTPGAAKAAPLLVVVLALLISFASRSRVQYELSGAAEAAGARRSRRRAARQDRRRGRSRGFR